MLRADELVGALRAAEYMRNPWYDIRDSDW